MVPSGDGSEREGRHALDLLYGDPAQRAAAAADRERMEAILAHLQRQDARQEALLAELRALRETLAAEGTGQSLRSLDDRIDAAARESAKARAALEDRLARIERSLQGIDALCKSAESTVRRLSNVETVLSGVSDAVGSSREQLSGRLTALEGWLDRLVSALQGVDRMPFTVNQIEDRVRFLQYAFWALALFALGVALVSKLQPLWRTVSGWLFG